MGIGGHDIFAHIKHQWIYQILCLGLATLIGAKEYCIGDTFEAKCGNGEVIVMTTARFGRMAIGRCIPKVRANYMNCESNVLPVMTTLCTGKRTCRVAVPNSKFLQDHNCPSDLGSYLEADFQCVKATTCNPLSRAPQTIKDASSGYITMDTNMSCHIHLQSSPGQHFDVTLINFYQATSDSQRTCANNVKFVNGYMETEGSLGRETESSKTVCARDPRFENEYESENNLLKTNINYMEPSNGASLLLRYEVRGCPNPSVPVGAYLRRNGDQADIACNRTSGHRSPGRWHLVCNGTTWVGKATSCFEGEPLHVRSDDHTFLLYPKGIVYAVLMGIGLGVVLGCVLLGLYVIFRFISGPSHDYERAHPDPSAYKACATDTTDDEYNTNLWLPQSGGYPDQPHSHPAPHFPNTMGAPCGAAIEPFTTHNALVQKQHASPSHTSALSHHTRTVTESPTLS